MESCERRSFIHRDQARSSRLNLEPTLYAAICAAAEIDPADRAGPDDDFRAATGDARPSEVKVFDYIYGVLHSWDFHIGGYQPAQKWLKDRRGRSISYDDIGHYQKIIKILTETDRIMKEIKLPLV